MGIDWDNEREILETFAARKGEGTADDYAIIEVHYAKDAEDIDQFAPPGTLGACIKEGKEGNADGWVEVGGLEFYATSTEVYSGKGYKSHNADVKWIGKKS